MSRLLGPSTNVFQLGRLWLYRIYKLLGVLGAVACPFSLKTSSALIEASTLLVYLLRFQPDRRCLAVPDHAFTTFMGGSAASKLRRQITRALHFA